MLRLFAQAALQFPGLGWRAYDEQFRLRQEVQPQRSWGEIDYELWLTVTAAGVTPAAARGAAPGVQVANNARARAGYCFARLEDTS